MEMLKSGTEDNRIANFAIKHRLLIFMLLTIAFKQLMVGGLPIFAHSGAGHDDRLMINMANTLVKGEWLGDYSEMTLVKGIFFPLLIAFGDVLKIPYTVLIPGFYALACLVFILGIQHLFRAKLPLYLLFVALLFNPISFADGTYLRVYRNCLTAAQVLIVFGCMFALYQNRFKKERWLLLSALGAGLGLSSLWHTREDGIWILPFILGVIFVTCISIYVKEDMHIGRKIMRSAIAFLPLGLLLVSTHAISSMNASTYGIYTNNELQKSHFTNAIKLIYSVVPDEDIERVSVPRSTVEKLYRVSPTLNQIADELEGSLDFWSHSEDDVEVKEVPDGYFFWGLREAASKAGMYENADKADAFYQDVSTELEAAFESGALKKRSTMPSALMSPWKEAYWKELPIAFGKTWNYVVSYDAMVMGMTASFDDGRNGIELFEKTTHNIAYRAGDPVTPADQLKISFLNKLIEIHQGSGVIFFGMAIFAYLVLSILTVFRKLREQLVLMDCWLFLTATLLSSFVLMIGVAYTDISAYVAISYWYLPGAYPLTVVFNVVTIYKLLECGVHMIFMKKRKLNQGQDRDES